MDDEDYEWLNQWKWHAIFSDDSNTYYAKRTDRTNGKQRSILMHREIVKTPIELFTDHKDHNGLNNQKYNLRVCVRQKNNWNKRIQSNNTSGYKGVSWNKPMKKWQAYIRKDYRKLSLGYFDSLEDAAKEYDKKAIEYFGEFAETNVGKR